MTNLTPSNFDILKKEYRDIILNDKPLDHQGKPSTITSSRCTFMLIDGSYLSVTELLKDGKIDRYYYEWRNKKKEVIIKFHSEPHDDKKFQTTTEPFHMHTKDTLEEYQRQPNRYYQDLNQVLNLIRTTLTIHKYMD